MDIETPDRVVACAVTLKRKAGPKSQAGREALARKQATEWNAKHLVGVSVCLHRDNGDCVPTVTRSGAEVLGGTAVIWLDGVSGCYALSSVHPREPTSPVQADAGKGGGNG